MKVTENFIAEYTITLDRDEVHSLLRLLENGASANTIETLGLSDLTNALIAYTGIPESGTYDWRYIAQLDI